LRPLERLLVTGGIGERGGEVGACIGWVCQDAVGPGDELL
jgi:hypothetical protein